MSSYDIIMLVVFVGAIWFGWWKGLAWQVASLAAIVASYFVSVKFREPLSGVISAQEPWNRIAAMLILFLGTSLVIWTIYASVSKSLKKMELKGFDSQAGALLGAVKGAILCMVITMFSVSLLGEKAHDAIHNSRSGYYVVRGISQVSAIVPAELAPYVNPYVDKFKNAIGHDLDLPQNQYPQFNQYGSAGSNQQDPNRVPSYPGTWQTPTAPANNQNISQPAGYQQPNNNQTTNAPKNGPANSGSWFPNIGVNNNANNANQTNSAGNGSGNLNNGWPDVNFQVNSKEVFDAAKRAAADAARRAINQVDQQR